MFRADGYMKCLSSVGTEYIVATDFYPLNKNDELNENPVGMAYF
ncbi:MAG: hypothetical protein PHC28_00885 [Flavobacterium sp.]|nr:hypothetical protein [Flavobacterium sp.]MDD5149023.1 hypothetical protein [Flavobacterium sp.]